MRRDHSNLFGSADFKGLLLDHGRIDAVVISNDLYREMSNRISFFVERASFFVPESEVVAIPGHSKTAFLTVRELVLIRQIEANLTNSDIASVAQIETRTVAERIHLLADKLVPRDSRPLRDQRLPRAIIKQWLEDNSRLQNVRLVTSLHPTTPGSRGSIAGMATGGWLGRLYQHWIDQGDQLADIQLVKAPWVQTGYFQFFMIGVPMIIASFWSIQASWIVAIIAYNVSKRLYGSRRIHPRVYKGMGIFPKLATKEDLKELQRRARIENIFQIVAIVLGQLALAIPLVSIDQPWNPVTARTFVFLGGLTGLIPGFLAALFYHQSSNLKARKTGEVIGTAPTPAVSKEGDADDQPAIVEDPNLMSVEVTGDLKEFLTVLSDLTGTPQPEILVHLARKGLESIGSASAILSESLKTLLPAPQKRNKKLPRTVDETIEFVRTKLEGHKDKDILEWRSLGYSYDEIEVELGRSADSLKVAYSNSLKDVKISESLKGILRREFDKRARARKLKIAA